MLYQYGFRSRPEREYKESPTRIAEKILGPVDWVSDCQGFIECPGKELHSTPTGKKDCKVNIDGAPNLYCFHQSCAAVLEPLSKALQRALPSGDYSRGYRPLPPKGPTPQERLARRAGKALAGIIEKHSAPLEDSPTKLTGSIQGDALLFLELFQPDDVLWIGNKTDSGDDKEDFGEHKRCRNHFVPVWHWRRRLSGRVPHPDWRLTCPSVFKPGSYHRNNESVLATRYLVVESDQFENEKVTPVFQWLREFVALRAVVHSGNKSWHGYFNFPDPAQLAELKIILPKLGCDPKLFCPSQPARRPGGLRENGKFQQLLWLDLKGKP